MTDFELFTAATENWNTVFYIFSICLSFTFAFLVAGYLTAAKLQSQMVAIVVALYTMAAMWGTLALGVLRQTRSGAITEGNSMNMTDLATWGQLISSAAVLVTLVYLSIQTKQTATLLRSESRQPMIDVDLQLLTIHADWSIVIGLFRRR